MPALEMAQDTGKLIRWLKQEGDEVIEGEPLMEIETDKAAVEIEATASGRLANVSAAPGDEVPVGQVIALILAPGEDVPAPTAPVLEAEQRRLKEKPAAASSAPPVFLASPVAVRMGAEHGIDLSHVRPAGSRVEKADVLAYLRERSSGQDGKYRLHPASPKARRLARESDLAVESLVGSGPGGAVLTEDVKAALSEQPALVQETLAVGNIWRIMTERVEQSWRNAPHFYLQREVDTSRFIAWRDYANGRSERKITYTDLLVRVVATALQQHPRANASWWEGEIVLNQDVNVGLAAAVDEGLVVPVIHHADGMNLDEIASWREDLISKAQSSKLRPEDLRDGTFTISNLGMYGVDAFNAVVNPPQAAILAVGRIVERIVPVQGQPAVRPMMMLSLSCDHRVLDGARGALFLQTIAELIEEPLGIL